MRWSSSSSSSLHVFRTNNNKYIYIVLCCVIIVQTGEVWPLPCRSRWLVRQCTPRVACLSLSFFVYRPFPFFYSLIRLPTMSRADRRSTAVLPHCRASNIVRRLGHRALTGRGLGVIVHQHYGYRIHYELRGEFGSRSFEQRYPGYQPCQQACADMVRGSPGDLCECMLMRECLGVYVSQGYVGR